MGNVINIVCVDKELLTSEEFLKLRNENPSSIKRRSARPLHLGEDGFGKIEVTYKFYRI